jgi:hypothetical protein
LPCFAAAKERLEALINTVKDILQDLTEDLGAVGPLQFNLRKLIRLLGKVDRDTTVFPCPTALLESTIVEFTTNAQGLVQIFYLGAGWIEPILKCSVTWHIASLPRV